MGYQLQVHVLFLTCLTSLIQIVFKMFTQCKFLCMIVLTDIFSIACLRQFSHLLIPYLEKDLSVFDPEWYIMRPYLKDRPCTIHLTASVTEAAVKKACIMSP